jgi:UDP-N-acetylglucosamine 2-epimerase
MRWSDVLFAPSEFAVSNLRAMRYGFKTVDTRGNTIVEAVRYAREAAATAKRPSGPYVVATIHRVETIYSPTRLQTVVSVLEQIAKDRTVLFVLHDPTRRRLQRADLLDRLSHSESIQLLPLQPYLTFVKLMDGADLVVTDGGSIQEECNALGVPCLIMRSRTERVEGVGESAYLAEFRLDKIERFLSAIPDVRRSEMNDDTCPSKIIVDHLLTRHAP